MHLDREPYVVHGIRKDTRQEIRIGLSERGGHKFVDIRLCIRKGRGAWIPTQNGCTVPADQLGELLLAVRKLEQALER